MRALLVAAVLLAPLPPAHAAPPPRVSLRLDYARGPGAEACPADTALREAIARGMGYDPFEPSDPPSPDHLTVAVSREGRVWAALVERYGSDGKRAWAETFRASGDDCAALISPLASGIRGWLLQGGSLGEPQPAPGRTAPHRIFGLDGNDPVRPAGPTFNPPAPQPPDRPAPVAKPDRKRFELALMGNLVLNGEPAVTGGAALRAALRWTWLSVGVEGRFELPAGVAATGIMGASGARYQGRTIAAALVPCAVYEHPTVQPFGCAVISAGAMTETGSGVNMPGTDTGFVLATGPRVGLDIPFSPRVPLSLRASFDALFFPVGARFHLTGTEVWKTPTVSGVAGVGLAAFF